MTWITTSKPEGRERNRPLKDYAGYKFGRLTAMSLVERDSAWNNHKWLFLCECGTEKVAGIKQVRSGKTKSCGCALRDALVGRNKTHGLSSDHPREYRIWKGMRDRCRRASSKSYKNYGGRGISVCPEWEDFAVFMKDMGPCPDGESIDRIDVNAGYSARNCMWQTDKGQANNRRTNHAITFLGETKTLQQWCEHFGIEPSKVRYRIKQGWPLERVFSSEDGRKR